MRWMRDGSIPRSLTSQIKNSIDIETFREIGVAEVRAQEVDKNLQLLKKDLKNYYNSDFFREDSKLIKKIHQLLTNKLSDLPGTDVAPVPIASLPTSSNDSINQNPPPSQTSRHALDPVSAAPSRPPTSSELRSRRGQGFSMAQSAVPPNQRLRSPPVTTNEQSSSSTTTSSTSVFKTVLITDSILRHVQGTDTVNALGKGHQLHLINKRNSARLKDHGVLNDLKALKPDFVYVHLGVNDVYQNFELHHSLVNFINFHIFLTQNLPEAKLFISLPLLTGDPQANGRIGELRKAIEELVKMTQRRSPGPLKNQTMLINQNINFTANGQLKGEYYGSDGVHLSDRGKEVILGNFRHHIHDLTSLIRNHPRRRKTSIV